MKELFTAASRSSLRELLVATARADDAVVTAALVGSAARGEEDRWSDIDLVLGIATGVDPDDVAARWTTTMYRDHDAVDHLDVVAGGVLYRVFLLGSSLQVDVSFWPQQQVRATEPGFTLLFGEVNPASSPSPPDRHRLIGWAWLYALHARSALARGRRWQAVSMLDLLRDQVVALACVRHGLSAHHGRGVDRLPREILDALAASHAAGVGLDDLTARAAGLLDMLQVEVEAVDAELAARLRPALTLLRS